MAGAAASAKSGAKKSGDGGDASKQPAQPRDFNKRWWCYLALAVFSLACLLSVSDVDVDRNYSVNIHIKNAAFAFSLVSFIVSILILIFDAVNSNHPLGGEPGRWCDLKNMDKNQEGILLALFALWWTGGVALMTGTNGIAYSALNIYFSAWACFFFSLYTLNDWSSEKDIISFRQLTHLSWTLRSWYALLFFSTVVFASTIDGFSVFRQIDAAAAAFAVATGVLSAICSLCMILAHYKLLCCFCGYEVKTGGWLELTVALVLLVWWLVELVLSTSYGGFAATIDGSGCASNPNDGDQGGEATGTPGSNVYLSSWLSFGSACYVVKQWKAERAVEFAHTQQSMLNDLMDEEESKKKVKAIDSVEDNDI